MGKVAISELIDGLNGISDEDFVCDNVYAYLSENPVDTGSIEKYFHWSPDFYTRNLIYKDARYELMAVCWEPGQVSRVHDHAEQRCWMTVPVGQLTGQNFAVEEIDEPRGFCKLRETDSFQLSDCLTAKVELEEPIHQVLNLSDDRAVSVHIYSKPFNKCISYCRDTDSFKEVDLHYTSIDGNLCADLHLSHAD